MARYKRIPYSTPTAVRQNAYIADMLTRDYETGIFIEIQTGAYLLLGPV
jgi:hypothetical protein